MNEKNLEKVLNQYIERFEEFDDPDSHNETYKWQAVAHFQEHWDIDAEDFPAMFKEATAETSVLLDGGSILPRSGILYLMKQEDEAEFVRECFKNLFAEDNGDLLARQNKVEAFVENINSHIVKYHSGYKYPQSFNTAMVYLNLWNPTENFFYKYTLAKDWQYCVEFGDDFGSGSNFSLQKYYKMCEELLSVLPKYETLIDKYNHRTEVFDDQMHILVYDIMHCAEAYGLYAGMALKKKDKEELARIAERERVRAEIQKREDELSSLEEKELLEYDLTGYSLKHRKYGMGKVLSCKDDMMEVEFANSMKKFACVESIAKGFFLMDNVDIVNDLKYTYEVTAQMDKIKREIWVLNLQYEKI